MTPTQALVASVWCELLQVEAISLTETFFEAGGHSMLAVQAVYQLAERTGTELELEAFFELATVVAVAAEIDRQIALRRGGAPALVHEGDL